MKGSSLAWLLLIGLVLVVVGLAALKYLINRDYLVLALVECDPQTQPCFAGDGVDYPLAYKYIEKPASTIPYCDAWAGECEPLSCEPNEPKMCTEILCDAEGGDECAIPEEVLEEEMMEEDVTEEEPAS